MRKQAPASVLHKDRKNKRSVPHTMPHTRTKKPQVNERLVLVYAGLTTAFRVCEFNNWDTMVQFISRNKLTKDEFTVLQGTVVSITPAYRDRLNHPSDMIDVDGLEDMNAETKVANPEAPSCDS